MTSKKVYQVIVGSGADADDGLDVYIVGDYPSHSAAIDAAAEIKADDRARAWIDVLEEDGSGNLVYVKHYDVEDVAKAIEDYGLVMKHEITIKQGDCIYVTVGDHVYYLQTNKPPGGEREYIAHRWSTDPVDNEVYHAKWEKSDGNSIWNTLFITTIGKWRAES
jgi:hypothetical protein|tara:strand:- start:159 stop:650 length:492 start_codon:yes stop_codon:yes gene_type:complete